MSLEQMPLMPSSILFVHQGYELYGSDRTLIQSVQAATSRWPQARITVLLPSDGVLRTALLAIVDDVRIADLAVLRKSNLKNLKVQQLGAFIRKVFEARRMMLAYEVTYINTVLIMDYMIAASLVRRPRIVHVHEIPTGVEAVLFSLLLIVTRAFLIFNSGATRFSFTVPFWQYWAIVWNGVAAVPEISTAGQHDKLNLLLIGRFNSWKGQDVFLQAVARLSPEHRSRVSVRLVGSVFGDQAHFAEKLERIVEEQGLSEIVEMCPFAPNPGPHYSWADVVVVPSTKPEPFGLVAIEGMAAGRCVIASNHGGLTEIVVAGETGSLIEPDSVERLAEVIASYIESPSRVTAEGNAGRKRFAAKFEESHYKLKIAEIISELVKSNAA
jgi:glycosyltransferase involved in cell wall biosynthesis